MTFQCTQAYYSTGARNIFELKSRLKSIGWTVPSSSDGTTYNASGDQITTGSSGAGGMENSSAWFVIVSPTIDGYNKSFSIQRSSNTNWRVKYSFSSGFSGGTPGATRTPSASDEQIILGGGSDASPSFGNWLTSDGTYRSIFVLGEAAEDYNIYFINFVLGSPNNSRSAFIFDSVSALTAATEDVDRHLVGINNNLWAVSVMTSASIGLQTWYRKNLSSESFVRCPLQTYQTALSNWHTSLSTAIGNTFTLLPVVFGRSSSLGGNTGVKGVSRFLKQFGPVRHSPTRYSDGTTNWFVLESLAIPWLSNEEIVF